MARPKTGTIWRSPDGKELKARISVRDASGVARRPWVQLDPALSDDDARTVAAQITKEAQGQVYNPASLQRAAELGVSPTVATFVSKVWLPSRTGKIKSLRSDESRWRNHLEPLIGHLKMAEVTTEHMRAVVEALDGKADANEGIGGRGFGEKTAVNVWALCCALFRDASSSKRKEVRILKSNPTDGVLPPDGPDDVVKQWLYPEELRQLLGCREVPLGRRRLYAACVYLFCRPGEVLGLLWGQSIDLRHGIVTINRAFNSESRGFNEYTKTGDTRRFAIEEVLMPLLERMGRDGADGSAVFPVVNDMARTLREDLWRAGVRRDALHVKRKGARLMRFHDLRATGITYLALRGDSDNEVRDRAGHTDFKTTLEYIRRGQHVVGARLGDPFAPLPLALLGVSSGSVPGTGGNLDNQGDRRGMVSRPEDLENSEDARKLALQGAPWPRPGILRPTQDNSETIDQADREAFAVALLEHQGACPPARPVTKTRPRPYVARKRTGAARG